MFLPQTGCEASLSCGHEAGVWGPRGPGRTPWAPAPLVDTRGRTLWSVSRGADVSIIPSTNPFLPPQLLRDSVHVTWPPHHMTLPSWSQLIGPEMDTGLRWPNQILDTPKIWKRLNQTEVTRLGRSSGGEVTMWGPWVGMGPQREREEGERMDVAPKKNEESICCGLAGFS